MVHNVDACSDIFSSILFQLKNVIDIKGTTLLVKIKQVCFPTDYVRSRRRRETWYKEKWTIMYKNKGKQCRLFEHSFTAG